MDFYRTTNIMMNNLVFLQVISPTSVIGGVLTLHYYALTRSLKNPYAKYK